MRLYRGKIPEIAEEIIDVLVRSGDIEVQPELMGEARLDVESVLHEYRRRDREILERAKDLAAERGLDYSRAHRLRQRLAAQQGFGLGEDAYEYLVGQLLEMFLHSRNIDEVYAEDHELRRKIVPVLRKHTELEQDLDRQVRARIQNLSEGTAEFDIEYQRVMARIREQRGLSD